ncbi:hypothetical protein ACFXHA_05735 [Nocardia sp. NPDC059240]|uniref:hypothetical protein n=1 Tax=Nocardia sp. NPDC059240 TaxID=3346786 RepID=UPI0036BAE5C3
MTPPNGWPEAAEFSAGKGFAPCLVSWDDSSVIDWLATDSAPINAALTSRDLLVLGAPIATVLAALIGGVIVIRNARKTPFDRLELLMKVRASWPAGLGSRDSLDRALLRAVAAVRVIEGDRRGPSQTDEEREAFGRALERDRAQLAALGAGVVGWVLFNGFVYTSSHPSASYAELAAIWGVGLVYVVVPGVVLAFVGRSVLGRRFPPHLLRDGSSNDGNHDGLVFDY